MKTFIYINSQHYYQVINIFPLGFLWSKFDEFQRSLTRQKGSVGTWWDFENGRSSCYVENFYHNSDNHSLRRIYNMSIGVVMEQKSPVDVVSQEKKLFYSTIQISQLHNVVALYRYILFRFQQFVIKYSTWIPKNIEKSYSFLHQTPLKLNC